MNEPVNIDERLAALLDGRLDEAERNALLAELAVPGDDYTVLAETASILLAMEEEDARSGEAGAVAAPGGAPGHEPSAAEGRVPAGAPAGVVPLRPRAPVWRRPAVSMAMAACLAALVVAGALLFRGRDSAAGGPVELAMALERGGGGMPAGWTDRTRWMEFRGEAAGSERARAVRAGALLLDLSVAVRAGDVARIERLGGELHAGYTSHGGAQSPFRRIAERAGAPRDSLLPLVAEGTERLERLGREPLRAGAWLEAASLAVERADAAFFREHRVPPAVERLARDDDAARGALSRVRAALPADAAPRWNDLEPALRALLSELAS